MKWIKCNFCSKQSPRKHFSCTTVTSPFSHWSASENSHSYAEHKTVHTNIFYSIQRVVNSFLFWRSYYITQNTRTRTHTYLLCFPRILFVPAAVSEGEKSLFGRRCFYFFRQTWVASSSLLSVTASLLSPEQTVALLTSTFMFRSLCPYLHYICKFNSIQIVLHHALNKCNYQNIYFLNLQFKYWR